MDIASWLDRMKLGRYAPAFLENDIDGEVLACLTADDLVGLGVTSIGHRRKLLDAIAALRDAGTPGRPTPAPPASMAAGQPPKGERRQLTVLFADLVGSTALSARLDPEEMGQLLRAYHDAVAAVVARFDGHVAKLMGDGVLAYFGWPNAHEDGPERAVRAGLGIAEAVSRLAAPTDEPLEARIGIATGRVVVGDLVGKGAAREETVVGETPNLAARLQAMAEPGTVVIADGTRRLLRGVFALHDLGSVPLKGFDEPVPAFRALGERPADSRFWTGRQGVPSPMVGREQELAVVLDRWRQAAAGEGQALLLVGEAGIGKSRLAQAAFDTAIEAGQTVLRYQCSPHHTGTALWPVTQHLASAASLDPADSDAAKLEKLEALLRRGVEDAGEVAALVAPLLGIDPTARYGRAADLAPQRRRARTLAALVEALVGLSRRRGPVLMMLEDAHWIDPTTLELVGLEIDRIANARVLMLVTSRPDGQPSLGGHAHLSRLTLNRLGQGPSEAIAARLAGDQPLSADLLQEITARTDGVPLFVEELTKAVLEAGASGMASAVPSSLVDTLMARLDRVGGAKEVAQVASCIGREFAYDLLATVLPMPGPELRAALGRLTAAELVFTHGEPSEANYSFKHALLRDAAHDSLLRSRRQEIHARIAETLERSGSTAAGLQPELLAHHHAEAARPEVAARYWSEAAQQAFDRSAMQEAVAHATAGLDAVECLPDGPARAQREAALLAALALALKASKGVGHPATEKAFERAHALMRGRADWPLAFPVLFGLWHAHWFQGQLGPAREEAGELLGLAQREGSGEQRLVAENAIGSCLIHAGDNAGGLEHFERMKALYDPERDDPLASKYMVNFGVSRGFSAAMARFALGWPDAAMADAREAIAYARTRQPINLVAALNFGAHVPISRGDASVALEWAEESLSLAQARGFEFAVGFARVNRGWACARLGRADAGIADIHAGIALWRGSGAGLWEPRHLLLLAAACIAAGRALEAIAAADLALALARRTGQGHFEAPLLVARGDARLMAGGRRAAEAESDYRDAVDVAHAQSARSWEIRAAIPLARLLHARGDAALARGMLAPLYGWFSEGLDTEDLRNARALLDGAA